MRTFLLAWNPELWPVSSFQKLVEQFSSKGKASDVWGIGKRRKLPVGSRVFLIRLGQDPKGVVASGVTTGSPKERLHWGSEGKAKGQKYWCVDLDFDHIDASPVITAEELQSSPFNEFGWWIQASGVELPAHMAAALEKRWLQNLNATESNVAEETSSQDLHSEGAKRQRTVNIYERDKSARRACIRHFGAGCSVCGFSFSKTYGPQFEGFIHVHHLELISAKGGAGPVDHKKDLRPVCANCHAVIHHRQRQRKVPYTIDEVRKLIGDAAGLA